MKKNQIRIGLLVGLLLVNAIIFFGGSKSTELSYDPNKFKLSEEATLTSMKLSSDQGAVLLSKNDAGNWLLNNSFKADGQLVSLLIKIMENVTVRRPVDVVPEGKPIDVEMEDTSGSMRYQVWGNATKTKTFFTDQTGTYEVEIPGYRDYLGSIFSLKTNQWRDREIFNGNWRTIQKLELNYQKTVSITFENSFYKVDGIAAIDSSRVVDYLNLFERFQVNEIITKDQVPYLDSLLATKPLAKLVIESIDYATPKSITIYPHVNQEPYQVINTESGISAVVDAARISKILVSPTYFEFKTKTK